MILNVCKGIFVAAVVGRYGHYVAVAVIHVTQV